MSKFLALGFTLEQVVAMATINPAKVINRVPKLGTLQIGAPGDVAIMELVEGPVSFVDTRNNSATARPISSRCRRRGRRAVRPAVQFAVRGEMIRRDEPKRPRQLRGRISRASYSSGSIAQVDCS